MSVPTHPNEDEYSALLIVSTTKHYPFQCAEVVDMKASADNSLQLSAGASMKGIRADRLDCPSWKQKESMICMANHAL